MLSVVIPALNEEAAIAETVETVARGLREAGIEHEIIVVSDGSTDRTAELAKGAGATVIEHPAPGGYGKSLKDGIRRAKYDLIGITDGDGTYPNDRLPDLYRLCAEKGFDMAVGARTGRHYYGGALKMPARRVFLWLSEYATGRRIADVNSGLRVFKKEIVSRYERTISNGFSFTTTITLATLLNGYFITYLPIDYFQRKGHESHVRYWRDTLRATQIIVENILYYNPLKLFLLLVAAMLLVAALAGAACLLVGPSFQRAVLLLALISAGSVGAAFVTVGVGLAAILDRFTDRDR
jgi:polyisoprenyl-phosphate glycosyltransferase